MSDNSIGELATEDANSSVAYAACQTKHAEVTGLYLYWREQILQYVKTLEEEEQ